MCVYVGVHGWEYLDWETNKIVYGIPDKTDESIVESALTLETNLFCFRTSSLKPSSCEIYMGCRHLSESEYSVTIFQQIMRWFGRAEADK